MVKNLLSNTNISFQKAKNLSYCISRLVELFFLKKEYHNVINIGKMGESLNKRIGENIGLYIIWAYSGASNLFLKGETNDDKYVDRAESNFIKHFDALIKDGADNQYFVSPIEGILYCCKEKSDYSLFDKLKNEMYEHMRFINSNMKFKELERSLIRKDIGLKDLIPVKKSDDNTIKFKDETMALNQDIFNILYCIAKSDGHVSKSEMHDITESVNAVSFSIGVRVEISPLNVVNIKDSIDQIELIQIPSF